MSRYIVWLIILDFSERKVSIKRRYGILFSLFPALLNFKAKLIARSLPFGDSTELKLNKMQKIVFLTLFCRINKRPIKLV